MGSSFDDGVMRDAHDGAVGAIQGHRNPGGLLKQLIQLFLKVCCRSIHGLASAWGMTVFLNRRFAELYHRIVRFLY